MAEGTLGPTVKRGARFVDSIPCILKGPRITFPGWSRASRDRSWSVGSRSHAFDTPNEQTPLCIRDVPPHGVTLHRSLPLLSGGTARPWRSSTSRSPEPNCTRWIPSTWINCCTKWRRSLSSTSVSVSFNSQYWKCRLIELSSGGMLCSNYYRSRLLSSRVAVLWKIGNFIIEERWIRSIPTELLEAK